MTSRLKSDGESETIELAKRQLVVAEEKITSALRKIPRKHRRSPAVKAQAMPKKPQILTVEEMKSRSGAFYKLSPKVRIDAQKIPEEFWPLLPYAEFWGLFGDWDQDDNPQISMEELVEAAPLEIRRSFLALIQAWEQRLGAWLDPDHCSLDPVSDEYVTFVAMQMAADYALALKGRSRDDDGEDND